MSIEDKFAVQELIACFANSFDVKDWNRLESCFTAWLYTDYSDLRGTPPQTISAAEYIRQRRESLDHLKLHHLVSNYEVDFTDSNSATCRASMVVWRKTDEEEFTSHCVYIFQLVKHDSEWKLSGITQKVLWNEGTSSIHQGAK
ncbi:MAG TPA: nuclear transport factor 2 family protein [Anaerolineales bacterium]|nr:nuclear transport factor 2 family protein [Anaerolineales bacterium]